MFHSTRIKLTAWYLLIIMSVSILFSITIYSGINRELKRIETFQKIRQERFENRFRDFSIPPPQIQQGLEEIQNSREHLILVLVFINIGIFILSGGAGYFLAGRTLLPIQEMVDEQNRFITDASHELRTPLTSLRSEIEVNLRDKNLTLAQTKKLLESNLEEVISLQTLSDTLITLTRHKKTQAAFIKLSLSMVIAEAVKKIAPLAKQKHITITTKLRDSIFEGEKQSIVELFIILLDNAVKYSPKNSKVTIAEESSDSFLIVAVTDCGIGIGQKDIPHIFNRFYQADKARQKSQAGGYGLGLSIAKKIAETHKGSISVESKINKGSIFRVKLPIL